MKNIKQVIPRFYYILILVLIVIIPTVIIAEEEVFCAEPCMNKFNLYVGGVRNLIWVFVVFIVIITSIFKKKCIRRWWRMMHGFFFIQGVKDLDKKCLSLNDKVMIEIKEKIPIAIVDNDSRSSRGARLLLDSMGYKKLVERYPIRIKDDVMSSNLMFIIDIKGVSFDVGRNAKEKYEGLSVAKHIKEFRPCARVIMYSSAIDEYAGNYILENMVDEKFEKGDGLSEKMKKIERCVYQLFSPFEFWQWYERDILASSHTAIEIANIEKVFARELNKEFTYSVHGLIRAYKSISQYDDSIKWLVNILSNIEWGAQ